MTRIIGGVAGGRRLQTPKGAQTRPTADRVREALFSAVESWALRLDRPGEADGDPDPDEHAALHGIRVLDLYAGSGALGLEAWSRGAASVTLVEADRRTADVVRANARAVGCGVADVRARSVASVLGERPPAPYDLVLSDPPYPLSETDLAADLDLLATRGWLADDALVVVERGTRSPEPTWPAGLGLLPGRRGRRKYGETTLWFAGFVVPVGDH